MTDYPALECAHGRIVGPLHREFFPEIHTSKFGLIPKKTPGEWMLIVVDWWFQVQWDSEKAGTYSKQHHVQRDATDCVGLRDLGRLLEGLGGNSLL